MSISYSDMTVVWLYMHFHNISISYSNLLGRKRSKSRENSTFLIYWFFKMGLEP